MCSCLSILYILYQDWQKLNVQSNKRKVISSFELMIIITSYYHLLPFKIEQDMCYIK